AEYPGDAVRPALEARRIVGRGVQLIAPHTHELRVILVLDRMALPSNEFRMTQWGDLVGVAQVHDHAHARLGQALPTFGGEIVESRSAVETAESGHGIAA